MTTIALASCCKIQQTAAQPAWARISAAKPDLLLLLGDIAYMSQRTAGIPPRPVWNYAQLASVFDRQLQHPGFASAIATLPYMAVWDDHDFGPNDSAGGVGEGKQHRWTARKLFREKLAGAINNNAPNLYCSHVVGDVKVIMLDSRFYRTLPGSGASATLLGKTQEQWLAQELQHGQRYTVVGCGTPIGDSGYDGSWGQFPQALARLEALLAQVPRLVYVAGDAHRNYLTQRSGYIEVVCSGIGRKAKDGSDMDNFGFLDFDPQGMRIRLIGNHSGSTKTRQVSAATWKLP